VRHHTLQTRLQSRLNDLTDGPDAAGRLPAVKALLARSNAHCDRHARWIDAPVLAGWLRTALVLGVGFPRYELLDYGLATD